MANIPGIEIQSDIGTAANMDEINNESIVCLFELPFRIPLDDSFYRFEMDDERFEFEIGLKKIDQRMAMSQNILTIDKYGQSSTTNARVVIRESIVNCEKVYKEPNLL